MAENTHGLDQSRAHAAASRRYSAAKDRLIHAQNVYTLSPSDMHLGMLEGAEAFLEERKVAMDAAYKAYTNPFGAVKTFS